MIRRFDELHLYSFVLLERKKMIIFSSGCRDRKILFFFKKKKEFMQLEKESSLEQWAMKQKWIVIFKSLLFCCCVYAYSYVLRSF